MQVRIGNINALIMMLAFFTVFSCSKDKEDEVQEELDQRVRQAELKTILETDNLAAVADDVIVGIVNSEQSGKSAKNDEDCYETEYGEAGFSVTFDQCTADEGGETLNGTLTVIYANEGEAKAFTVAYDDLMVDDITINGSRSFTIAQGETENSAEMTIVGNISITMADGEVISEDGSKTIAIVFGEQFGDGALTLDGEWTVKADGNTYSVKVTDLLETQFGCEYVGKGLMLLNKNGLEVAVDFGNGDCDDAAVVTYPDGTQETVYTDK